MTHWSRRILALQLTLLMVGVSVLNGWAQAGLEKKGVEKGRVETAPNAPLFKPISTSQWLYREEDVSALMGKIQALQWQSPPPDADGNLTWKKVMDQTLAHDLDVKLSQEKINETEVKREDVETKRVLFFFKYFDATFLEGSAESDVMAASAHAQSITQSSLLESLGDYFNLMRAVMAQAVSYQQIQQGTSQLKVNEYHFQSGEANRFDLSQTQAQLIQRYQEFLSAEQRVKEAYLLLADKISLPQTPLALPGEFQWHDEYIEVPMLQFFSGTNKVPTEAEAIQVALENRPDIKELKLRRISLENLYKVSNVKFHKSQEKILKSSVKQLDFKQKQLNIHTEALIRKALSALDTGKEKLSLAQTQVSLAKNTLSQAKKAHLAGFSSNKDVLDAQVVYAQAQMGFANSVLDYNLAQLDLLYQMGQLTPEHLTQGKIEL